MIRATIDIPYVDQPHRFSGTWLRNYVNRKLHELYPKGSKVVIHSTEYYNCIDNSDIGVHVEYTVEESLAVDDPIAASFRF